MNVKAGYHNQEKVPL